MARVAERPAWYARPAGGWRDWLNILHPPYTLWHLSYVALGAGLAPRLNGGYLAATLAAFALAVGVAAHALDELRGRPLGTAIPSGTLVAASAAALTGAAGLGALGVTRLGWPLALFIVAGGLLVVGYNLEPFGGILHNDVTFAASWGAFPVLTGYYAQTQTIRLAAVAGAAFAFGLAWTQRMLSTESRWLRRTVRSVDGEVVLHDGQRRPLGRPELLAPLDRALHALSWTIVLLAAAVLASHLY